ncbi:sugar transferase [Streptomyces sp. NPDC059092]|uniref:sugar transferase n=1 Tax=Streptomyces sp. NPDC059092 TaxID=3346725 RepID=UPI0036A1ACF2
MTTESTSVPPPPGRARTAQQHGERNQGQPTARLSPAKQSLPSLSQQAVGQQSVGQQSVGQQSTGQQSTGQQSVGQQALGGRVALAPPRDATDRVARQPRRTPAHDALRFGLPLVVVDGLAALLSTAVLGDEQRDTLLAVQLLACVAALNARAGLYRPGTVVSGLDQLPALAARIAVAWCAAAAVLAALLPAHALGLTALAGGGAVQLAVCGAGRALLHTYRRSLARDRLRSALVVGTGTAARRLAALLAQHPEYGLRPVGVASAAPEPGDADQNAGQDGHAHGAGTDVPALPVLTTAEEIHRAVIQNGVQEALFVDAGPGYGDPGEWTGRAGLVALFHEYGCATSFVGAGPWDTAAPPTLMEHHLWGLSRRRVEPPATHAHRCGTLAKRLLDLLIAVPALLAISPVLTVCALSIRLCDGPGVLFRQERVGQHGRPFTLLKFRTLRPSDDHESATRWNIAGDLRMSSVGSTLRRTSMDELPQLWNVLRGDMSLVGPRPERPFFVANFSKTHPGYAARHRMPVGITGLAQVHGLRGDTSIEERSRFDNHYIDHWSLWQDVCILVRTALSLVRPAGS